jgi:hypothetical protein
LPSEHKITQFFLKSSLAKNERQKSFPTKEEIIAEHVPPNTTSTAEQPESKREREKTTISFCEAKQFHTHKHSIIIPR